MIQHSPLKANDQGQSSTDSTYKAKSISPRSIAKYVKGQDFTIRSRPVFKSPLQKYTFETLEAKQKRNCELTNHCNYGFNYDTIKSYAIILKRFIETYDMIDSNNLYNSSSSGLIRLHDEIPIDFGGFSPAINQNIFNIEGRYDCSNGDIFFEHLIRICYLNEGQVISPLTQFVKKIYDDDNNIGDQLSFTSLVNSMLSNIMALYKTSMESILNKSKQQGIKQDENLYISNDLPESKELIQQYNFYDKLLTNHFLQISKKQNKQVTMIYPTICKNNSSENIQVLKNGKRIHIQFQRDDQIYSKAALRQDRTVYFKQKPLRQTDYEIIDTKKMKLKKQKEIEHQKSHSKKKEKHKKIKKHKTSKNKKHKKKNRHKAHHKKH